jgi:hypothetical protein
MAEAIASFLRGEKLSIPRWISNRKISEVD